MLLIFGLGNIGREYENTYHNIGFKCLNSFLEKNNLKLNKTKYKGSFVEIIMHGEKVVFVEPTTYMNNSGECVVNFINKFKVDVEDILVVYDDFDLPIGEVRFRNSGSSGTHNGMRDIVEKLGTDKFKRLRIGIKDKDVNIPLINYVLSHIRKSEEFEKVFVKTNDFIDKFISLSGKMENTTIWDLSLGKF